MSPKIFRQVLNTLGFQIGEDEVNAVALVYGNEDNSIRYADFLRDANCLEYVINGNTPVQNQLSVTDLLISMANGTIWPS